MGDDKGNSSSSKHSCLDNGNNYLLGSDLYPFQWLFPWLTSISFCFDSVAGQ